MPYLNPEAFGKHWRYGIADLACNVDFVASENVIFREGLQESAFPQRNSPILFRMAKFTTREAVESSSDGRRDVIPGHTAVDATMADF